MWDVHPGSRSRVKKAPVPDPQHCFNEEHEISRSLISGKSSNVRKYASISAFTMNAGILRREIIRVSFD